MILSRFKEVAEKRFEKCLDTMLVEKYEEYSPDGDKLHNFKVSARFENETPEKALWGMVKKHLASVQDLVNGLPDRVPTDKLVTAKLGDVINYMVLLEALIVERKELIDEEVKGAK